MSGKLPSSIEYTAERIRQELAQVAEAAETPAIAPASSRPSRAALAVVAASRPVSRVTTAEPEERSRPADREDIAPPAPPAVPPSRAEKSTPEAPMPPVVASFLEDWDRVGREVAMAYLQAPGLPLERRVQLKARIEEIAREVRPVPEGAARLAREIERALWPTLASEPTGARGYDLESYLGSLAFEETGLEAWRQRGLALQDVWRALERYGWPFLGRGILLDQLEAELRSVTRQLEADLCAGKVRDVAGRLNGILKLHDECLREARSIDVALSRESIEPLAASAKDELPQLEADLSSIEDRRLEIGATKAATSPAFLKGRAVKDAASRVYKCLIDAALEDERLRYSPDVAPRVTGERDLSKGQRGRLEQLTIDLVREAYPALGAELTPALWRAARR
jgi:hypothetical protein